MSTSYYRPVTVPEVPNNGGRPGVGAALSAVVVELLFVSLGRLTTTIS